MTFSEFNEKCNILTNKIQGMHVRWQVLIAKKDPHVKYDNLNGQLYVISQLHTNLRELFDKGARNEILLAAYHALNSEVMDNLNELTSIEHMIAPVSPLATLNAPPAYFWSYTPVQSPAPSPVRTPELEVILEEALSSPANIFS